MDKNMSVTKTKQSVDASTDLDKAPSEPIRLDLYREAKAKLELRLLLGHKDATFESEYRGVLELDKKFGNERYLLHQKAPGSK
jgi:hypothetical protein